MMQAGLERLQDVRLGLALHRQDEGEAKARLIGVIQLREPPPLRIRQHVEPGGGLLLRGVLREAPGRVQLPGEIGMGVDERELPLLRGGAHDRRHIGMQALGCVASGAEPVVIGTLRHPGGMFENAAEAGDELVAGEASHDHGQALHSSSIGCDPIAQPRLRV